MVALVLAIVALGAAVFYSGALSPSQYSLALLTSGNRSLTANWNAGAHNITASWFLGKVAWSNVVGVPSNLSGSGSVAWDNVTGKPLTFTPTAHSHAWSDIISGIPAFVVNSSGNYFSGKVAWANINGIPGTFTPSAHTHSASDITSGTKTSAFISDWGSYINQAVLTSSTPSFAGLTVYTQLTIQHDTPVQAYPRLYLNNPQANWLIENTQSGSLIFNNGATKLSFNFDDTITVYENINFDGAQTVDGVDISALLLKTTKVTNLGSIWDKTTKIAYGDTSFSDQNLLTSSGVTFNTINEIQSDGAPTLLLKGTSTDNWAFLTFQQYNSPNHMFQVKATTESSVDKYQIYYYDGNWKLAQTIDQSLNTWVYGSIYPNANNAFSLGDSGHKMSDVWTVNQHTGDQIFSNGWTITEYGNGLLFKNANGLTVAYLDDSGFHSGAPA